MNKLIRRPDIWISLALFLLMIPAERLELFSSMEKIVPLDMSSTPAALV